MVDQQKIGQRIALIRTKAGIDLRTFAGERGVSAAAVHQWENGSGVTHYNLMRICDVYEISPEWLMTGIGLPRRSFQNRMKLLSEARQDEGRRMMEIWLETIGMRTNDGGKGEDDREE